MADSIQWWYTTTRKVYDDDKGLKDAGGRVEVGGVLGGAKR